MQPTRASSGLASATAAKPPPAATGSGGSVRLRIEYFSNREAGFLSLFVYVATTCLILATLALVVTKFQESESEVLFHGNKWYIANLSIASVALAGLLALAGWLGINLYFTRREQKSWTFRRLALCRDSGIMLGIQIVSSIFWVAPYALTTQKSCMWFEDAIGWFAMIRWTCYNCILLWAVIMAHACTRYRGPNPPTNPDEQLVMDLQPRQKLWVHAPKALLWVPFQGLVGYGTYQRIKDSNDILSDNIGCEDFAYICEREATGKVLAFIEVLFVLVYAVVYLYYLRRAFADHALLPFCRYRLSNMYIRLVVRHGIIAFATLAFSFIVIQTVRFDSCWSYLDGSLGMAPVQLSLTLLVAVQVMALMPKNAHEHDTLTAVAQEFSWTQAGLSAAIAARDRQLHHAPEKRWHGLQRFLSTGRHVLEHAAQAARDVPEGLNRGIAGMMHQSNSQPIQKPEVCPSPCPDQKQSPPKAGMSRSLSSPARSPGRSLSAPRGSGAGLLGSSSQGANGVNPLPQAKPQQPEPEPMFCVELAVRLYHWSRYCYRHWQGTEGGMCQSTAQKLFELEGFEALWDKQTDTRALLSWRDGVVLLAFRGTASRTNAVTDLKLWQTPLLPRHHYEGRLVKVHAGFYRAYTANHDRQKVQERIAQIVDGFSEGAGLRFFLTGHSLGGALAVLAAYDLKCLYPQATVTLYTFGAPRVGNHAFAAEYRSLVPDSWQVVNDQDPVPRVPRTRFKHSGRPVVINTRGDIIVCPSYFERNVMQRSGGVVTHHLMSRIALALAACIKAQFSGSKQMPGGEAGATQLAGALDLGQALLLLHMDLKSLQDPDLLPECALRAVARAAGSNKTFVRRARSRLASLCGDAPEEEPQDAYLDGDAAVGMGGDVVVEAGLLEAAALADAAGGAGTAGTAGIAAAAVSVVDGSSLEQPDVPQAAGQGGQGQRQPAPGVEPPV